MIQPAGEKRASIVAQVGLKALTARAVGDAVPMQRLIPITRLHRPYEYVSAHFKRKYWVYILAAHVILLATLGLRHEPWVDEAQAWLLAKDSSVADLLVKYLRYEGSPGLWHLILMPVAKSNLPYFTITIISGIFATIGVWLFLRYSPFPFIIKLLFPFSYFAFFQYGVVARSYCLIPPLLFSLAIKYQTRMEQPYFFILLLCLLANVSTQGLLISMGIFSVHLLGVLKGWKRLDKRAIAHQAAAAAIFALVVGLVFLVLLPPSDLTFARGSNFGIYRFYRVTGLMLSRALTVDPMLGGGIFLRLQQAVALVVMIITLWWFRRKKKLLLYLAPLTAFLLLSAVKWHNFWHEGIPFFLWLFVLWVSFEERRNGEPSSLARRVVVVSIVVVLSVQVYWSAQAFRYDFYHNYSGSYDVAEYIKANGLENAKIYAFGWKSVAILPYFTDNIFDNHNGGSKQRFWLWTTRNKTIGGAGTKAVALIKRDQPDVVVFASPPFAPLRITEVNGYELVGLFDGNLCYKTGLPEYEYYMVFRKKSSS